MKKQNMISENWTNLCCLNKLIKIVIKIISDTNKIFDNLTLISGKLEKDM